MEGTATISEKLVAETLRDSFDEKRDKSDDGSQGSATSFTHYTGQSRNGTLEYSQLQLQTQAPYRSQVESQSQ